MPVHALWYVCRLVGVRLAYKGAAYNFEGLRISGYLGGVLGRGIYDLEFFWVRGPAAWAQSSILIDFGVFIVP